MAMEILSSLARERATQLLTPTEREVLTVAAGLEELNNVLLTELTNKQKQNSSTHLEKFVNVRLARRIRQEGNEIFYEVATDMRPLAAGSGVSPDE